MPFITIGNHSYNNTYNFYIIMNKKTYCRIMTTMLCGEVPSCLRGSVSTNQISS